MSNHGRHRSLQFTGGRTGDPAAGRRRVRGMQDVEAIVVMVVCLGLMYGFLAGFERL